tara:strand:- start:16 stop:291 length:276 start_codon:yes stop_codon:yes gene_type:complete
MSGQNIYIVKLQDSERFDDTDSVLISAHRTVEKAHDQALVALKAHLAIAWPESKHSYTSSVSSIPYEEGDMTVCIDEEYWVSVEVVAVQIH